MELGQVQTRSESNGLQFFDTLEMAEIAAELDPSIWKISYANPDGARTRLVRQSDGSWKDEPLMDIVNEMLGKKP